MQEVSNRSVLNSVLVYDYVFEIIFYRSSLTYMNVLPIREAIFL